MAEGGPRRRPPLLLPPQIAPVRSLRIKVLLVVASVAMAPQLFVAMWSVLEQNLAGEMRARVAYAAGEAAQRLLKIATRSTPRRSTTSPPSRQSGVRLRVLAGGRTLIDVDED